MIVRVSSSRTHLEHAHTVEHLIHALDRSLVHADQEVLEDDQIDIDLLQFISPWGHVHLCHHDESVVVEDLVLFACLRRAETILYCQWMQIKHATNLSECCSCRKLHIYKKGLLGLIVFEGLAEC